jgi:hypothetical protein
MTETTPSPLNNVITIDDERIKNHLDRVVRSSVEGTLNALLDCRRAQGVSLAQQCQATGTLGGPLLIGSPLFLDRPALLSIARKSKCLTLLDEERRRSCTAPTQRNKMGTVRRPSNCTSRRRRNGPGEGKIYSRPLASRRHRTFRICIRPWD